MTLIVLGCFSNAFAQVRYEVTDLGSLHDWNLGCAMSLNDRGWTEIMAGELDPLSNSTTAPSPSSLTSGPKLVDSSDHAYFRNFRAMHSRDTLREGATPGVVRNKDVVQDNTGHTHIDMNACGGQPASSPSSGS